MRSFISIDLPDSIINEISLIQKEIDKLGLIKGKFTERENIHLTLKFLGELSRSEIEFVKEKINGLDFKPISLRLDKIGVFNEDYVRIIWVSVKGEDIFDLQKMIDNSLEDIFPKEFNFMAHITLARPKFVEDKKTLIEELNKLNFNKEEFIINKINFKKSELGSKGSVYSDILECNANVN